MIYKWMVAVVLSLVLVSAGMAGHWPEPPKADVDMSVLVREVTGVEILPGAELACLTPRGDVRGLIVVDANGFPAGMSLKGDDASTPETDGFTTGDSLKFLYWNPATETESDVAITQIEVGEAKFAGNGWLVIKLQVEEGVNHPATMSPSDFKLTGPYPNPFNGKARVSFDLRSAGDVTLGLYNLNGTLVRTMAAGRYSAGTHNIELNGMALPSGMYLVALNSGSQLQVIRAVLLK